MGQKIAGAILAALVLAAAVWWWQIRGGLGPWQPALTSREIAARVLGEYLASQYPGAKAIVFANPFALRKGQDPEIYAFEKASIHGLEEGFGRRAEFRIVYPEIRPAFWKERTSVFVDPKTTTPLSFLVAENAFDQALNGEPAADLAVSFIGLPVNVRQKPFWQKEKPHFGLLLPDWRLLGGLRDVREAFQSGKIAAAVLARPGASLDEEISPQGDYGAEFQRRFFLVTKDNLEDLVRTYPKLF